MANIYTDVDISPRNLDGTFSALCGTTRNPDHTWRIDLAHAGHCYLFVDEEFILHGSMGDCTMYLARL